MSDRRSPLVSGPAPSFGTPQANQIILLTITLPIVLGVGGLLLCLAAAWIRWRHRGVPTATEDTP